MPGDPEDHEGDREPDQRVGDLEADRDDDRAGDDAEADGSVGAGVVAVGDERGAVQAAAPGALSREFGSGVGARSRMFPESRNSTAGGRAPAGSRSPVRRGAVRAA